VIQPLNCKRILPKQATKGTRIVFRVNHLPPETERRELLALF